MTTDTLAEVVAEHAEEAAFLWLQRNNAVHAPNYSHRQFADLDERLAAHVDGLRVAGDDGWRCAAEALHSAGPEDFFPAAVLAIESADGRFDELLARAQPAPQAVTGLMSALGWVEPEHLGGRVKALLGGDAPLARKLGITACALHRRDPGAALDAALDDTADSVRIRALRAAGELGRTDLLPHVLALLGEAKPELRFWAAWSAVLMGDRGHALDALRAFALEPGPRQLRAFQLVLQTLDVAAGHALLSECTGLPSAARLRIMGTGIVGDAHYAPWLIEQMAQPAAARIAAEAFVGITGVDFNLELMEVPPPEGFEDGPSEDPDDENVDLPEDVALPWPDVQRLHRWWQANAPRFAPGVRWFLGQPVSEAACAQVLCESFQRRRVAAALHRSMLQPGMPLFPTSAPAWRQKRWLSKI